MAQPINNCPLCGPKPDAREEVEQLDRPALRDWTKRICARCWNAIWDKYDDQPVNEAEESYEAWA